MAESFVYKVYKGKEITLPLTDKMREFLIARSKDNLIRECDEVWANLNNRPGETDEEETDEEFSYSELTKTELTSEINDRNKDREEEDKIVVPSGAKKDDLIALLEEDDEAAEDEQVPPTE